MKRILRHTWILVVLLLSAVNSSAEEYVLTQNFHALATASAIKFTDGNTVGRTDSVTYTCYATAKFGGYKVSGLTYICLLMANLNDSVMTSAVKDVSRFTMTYYPRNVDRSSAISISISLDGESWTEMSAAYEHSNGYLSFPMPVKGDYFIKIKNTTGSAFYIEGASYSIESCNCFRLQK